MSGSRTRLILAATCAVTTLSLATATIAAVVPKRTTRIASPPPEAGVAADGTSSNPDWSRDGRDARMLVFESEASNLVAGDTNGESDVFFMTRGRGTGDVGGRLAIASLGGRSTRANGESRNPSVDGIDRTRPRCVAFESRATNLASGDRSSDWDIFVRDTRRRTTRLASPGLTDARDAEIDGRCRYVVFSARGRVLVRDLARRRTHTIDRGHSPAMQDDGAGVAYVRGRHVYYRRLRSGRRTGRRVLASRGPRRSGNAQSGNPSLDRTGNYVAFDSRATNLCGSSSRWCRGVSRDRNRRTSDVFRATLSRRAPTRDRMQMASYSHRVRAQGNGDSNRPTISAAGEFITFDSEATNLRESRGIRKPDPNGRTRDIYNWNFPAGRGFGTVSRESRPGPSGELDGASFAPAISARGNYLAFVSVATDAPGDRNGAVADVFVRFMGGR